MSVNYLSALWWLSCLHINIQRSSFVHFSRQVIAVTNTDCRVPTKWWSGPVPARAVQVGPPRRCTVHSPHILGALCPPKPGPRRWLRAFQPAFSQLPQAFRSTLKSCRKLFIFGIVIVLLTHSMFFKWMKSVRNYYLVEKLPQCLTSFFISSTSMHLSHVDRNKV